MLRNIGSISYAYCACKGGLKSHVCAVFFQFSVQANELLVFQFCLIFWVSVRVN